MKAWADLARHSAAMAAMGAEAQAVIWMRLWGMAGLWNLGPGETRRMVAEKLAAAAAAQAAAGAALALGKAPAAVAAAALKPVRQRTRANVRRLRKRGMKI